MVDSLNDSGVKIIKTAKREPSLFPEEWKHHHYNGGNSFGENYYDHRMALELSQDHFIELKEYTENSGFEFSSSFTDLPSLEFLIDIGLETLKLASSRNIDSTLIRRVNEWAGRVIVSSGMTTHEDLEETVYLLRNCEVIVLQCTSAYPTEYQDIHLNYMIKEGLDGLSGHHEGTLPDIVAYSLGARWIERHYTLDREMKGTDHKLSVVRSEVDEIIDACSKIDLILGDNDKKILDCERKAIGKLRFDLLGQGESTLCSH